MGIKTFNPYTPSRRQMSGYDFSEITASTPEKSLTTSVKKNAGRNAQGKITVRHRGGGSRRKYRIIDFKRNKDGIPATVKSIEYDPNRTANIALICYADGEKAYILAPAGLKVGQQVMNGETAEARVGNCLELKDIPVGTLVHNIELYPGHGGQFVRAAGNSAQLMAIKTALGEKAAKKVMVSSTKGHTGHLIGAAGGVEAVVCAKAIQDSFVPATINYKVPDEECDLDIVPNEGRNIEVKYAMSNKKNGII